MMPIGTDTQSTPGRKDIFISYSRRDKTGVDGYLTPLLEAAHVPFVIDDRDFEVGQEIEDSIRQFIGQCRYTLLVMTPNWVNGKWTHYESLLATGDLDDNPDRHILALKLRDCDVPPHVARRLYPDIRRPRTRDAEIVKLLRQLGVQDDRIESARARIARKPGWFLCELLSEPEAQDAVVTIDELFDEIQDSNEVVTINKHLHDRLQEIEFPLQEVQALLPADGSNASDALQLTSRPARSRISALCEQLEKLTGFAATVVQTSVDVSFVTPLNGLADEILAAFRTQDIPSFRTYLGLITALVDRSLPRVNDRICEHVRERQLRDLARNLESIYEHVFETEFDDSVTELLTEFRRRIDRLIELEREIQLKVEDHRTLQNVDVTLHLCSPDDEPTFQMIARHWSRVEGRINSLKLTVRFERLLASAERLSRQLDDKEAVRDDCFEEAVKWDFDAFVDELTRSFNRLDIDLLADCARLKPETNELRDLLNRMRADDN